MASSGGAWIRLPSALACQQTLSRRIPSPSSCSKVQDQSRRGRSGLSPGGHRQKPLPPRPVRWRAAKESDARGRGNRSTLCEPPRLASRRFAGNDAATPANAQQADLDADHDLVELPRFTGWLCSLWPGLPQKRVSRTTVEREPLNPYLPTLLGLLTPPPAP